MKRHKYYANNFYPLKMEHETYFAIRTPNIEKLMQDSQKTWYKFFLNIRKENNKDILFLSRDKGQTLYIISTINYKNIEEYFSYKEDKIDKRVQEKDQKVAEVKRKKQGSLLSFFKKNNA